MSNFRSKSLVYFGLIDERALRSLLDLQPEEELQLTHHAHLELSGHLGPCDSLVEVT